MNSDVEATYIGAATNFKERYRNHTLSFKHQRYQHNTNLSSYVWSLKAENKPFNIQWSIAGKAPSYNPSMKCCKLCLLEKTLIMKSNDQVQLNKRSELMSKCRHRAKFLLSNTTWYCIKILNFFTMFTIICFNFASQRKIRKMYKKNPQDFSLFQTLVLKSVITRNIMFIR